MNEIINAIPEYIITAVVSTAVVYLMRVGKNLLHSKVQHAKTVQSKELWSFIEQVANTAVDSLVSANMSGSDKFVKATSIVQDTLNKQGFANVDVKSIESAVQSAYEKSPLTPTTNPEEKADKSGQKGKVIVPDGKAKAIDPKEVA
nr:MAG TPA: holin [Caudoviricetes sp.]